ncbi:MAG: proline--tRNA ligase [Desulfovermiculus sp.]|nr:proline--tRNA ligase [Desulfovermiculus sp.]
MRLSRYYVPTLKENPAEADVVSHRLLVRAGMIRKLTSGIYTFLPLGLRALDKTARIVREEMNRAGALEVFMPMVQPADLWQESGRWSEYGQELLRLQDRHSRDYCLGPTHEEVITDLVRHEIRSYRQLPVNLYQIQTKFRDEIRPRFGLMRCREFIMKDAYSFDRDEAGLDVTYWSMFNAYTRIFERLGLKFRSVEADSGPIGGSVSSEFMVLAETGEDVVVSCTSCSFAANLEKGEVRPPAESPRHPCPEPERVDTPGAHTVKELAAQLDISPAQVVKTMLYAADGQPIAALIPGDRELNDVKLRNFLNASELELATEEQIREWTGAPVGFAGPIGLKVQTVIADRLLTKGTDWVTGANQADAHYLHVDLDRDVKVQDSLDMVNIRPDDPCPECGGELAFHKGIEVGHVFKLGTKYSQSMQATFLDEDGKEQLMRMGCYGIGVSRIVAACIEQNHDQDGIIFPPPVSPFEVMVLALNAKDEQVMATAADITAQLEELGLDVLLDDREERPGFKFKDADLLGFSMHILVGSKGLSKGVLEVKDRRTGERQELPLDNFVSSFQAWRTQVWAGWGLEQRTEDR